jgi:hypothetical protein
MDMLNGLKSRLVVLLPQFDPMRDKNVLVFRYEIVGRFCQFAEGLEVVSRFLIFCCSHCHTIINCVGVECKQMTMINATITIGPGEQIIFHKTYKTGLLHRHVESDATITNQRVVLTKFNSFGMPTTYSYLLSDCSDILVAGQQRIGTGRHYGMSYGYGMRGNYGISNWQSVNVCSLIFMVGGAPAITLNGLEDPQGVCRMVESARKFILNNKVHDGMVGLLN